MLVDVPFTALQRLFWLRPGLLNIMSTMCVLSSSLGTLATPRVVHMQGEFPADVAQAIVPEAKGIAYDITSSRRRRRTLSAHNLDVDTNWAIPEADADARIAIVSDGTRASAASGDGKRIDGIVNMEGAHSSSSINTWKSHRSPRRQGLVPSALVADPSDSWEQDAERYDVIPQGWLLELHLHGITLKDLRRNTKSSVTEFLLPLHSELSRNLRSLSVLGIHERFQQRQERLPNQFGDEAEAVPARMSQEVIVRFEAVPKQAAGQMPEEVMQTLAAQLDDPACSLHNERFGFALANTSFTQASAPDLVASKVDVQADAKTWSAMALPIGISATFTGILLWLAAW